MDGYALHPTQRLITIFSAPNYCGEFDNAGAVMQVNLELGCSFTQFHSSKKLTPTTVINRNVFDERTIQMVDNPPAGMTPLIIAPTVIGERPTVIYMPIQGASSTQGLQKSQVKRIRLII
ncbi:unnamed protein product [Meloidogyne enterolobii]|uniref:Uncharacterized protein n=1 Tax=Meloidogyne enterolobii TaxID=390850 RepID=A0ACB0XQD1_MELEN